MTQKKEKENKTYFMWYVNIKDIELSVKEALDYYLKKGNKILSIEVSKLDCQKSFTVGEILVRPKKEILKNHIYLEMENKENVESKE